MTKVSKALIILPGDRTNKINFPFSLWVFKCVLWWRSIVYFWKSCVAERKANRSNDTGMLTNGGPADGFISTPMPGGGGEGGATPLKKVAQHECAFSQLHSYCHYKSHGTTIPQKSVHGIYWDIKKERIREKYALHLLNNDCTSNVTICAKKVV